MLKYLSHLIITLLAIIPGVSPASAPAIMNWQRCFGGSAQDIPGAIIRSADGNYIVLGNADSNNGDVVNNSGSTDIWLSKVDTLGNIIWKRTVGGSSIDVGTSVVELPGGKFLIAGYSSSTDGPFTSNKGAFDVILLCVDRAGNLLWEKSFGGSQVDLCYSMYRSSDGNLILAGSTYSNDMDVTSNKGNQDAWILKTDTNGNLIWQISLGGSGGDICYGLAEDQSGNIYATGTTNSNDGDITSSHGNNDLWVIKLNSHGQQNWNRTFGGSEYETAQCILIDAQQRILIGGYTRSDNDDITSNMGFGDCWFIQVSSQGSLMFQQTLGGTGSENLYSLIQTSDGGYLLASGSTSDDFNIKNPVGFEDVWLLKLSSQFAIEWSKNYGGTSNDRPVKLINTLNGGYALAAYTFSNNIDVSGQHGVSDLWVVDFGCKNPVASFSTAYNGCLGDTIIVQNTSVNATGYTWSINNTFFSSNNSISIPLIATGNYHLELNASTCSITSAASADINVVNCALPTVSISASSNNICANSQVTFSDSSSNTTAWQWTFPGGNPSTSTLRNPVVTYSQPGVYSVMLSATNNYGNQSVMRLNYITVNSVPATPVITVTGNQFTSSFAQSYQWYMNNVPIPGANAGTYTAVADGFYSVRIYNSTGCGSISQQVYYSVTGITEKQSETVTAYPNPTNGPVVITLPKNADGNIIVYDMTGRVVDRKIVRNPDNSLNLSLSDVQPGTYRIVFTDNNYKSTYISIIKY